MMLGIRTGKMPRSCIQDLAGAGDIAGALTAAREVLGDMCQLL